MSPLEAALTLIVGVLASGALTEIVKRRNLRESIATDLDIWSKLPESATKTKLYDTLTTRVWQTTMKSQWPSIFFALLWWAGSLALTVVTYDIKLMQDERQVMRVVGGDVDLSLYNAGLAVAVYAVFVVLCTLAGAAIAEKLSGWSLSRQVRKGIERAKRDTVAEFARHPEKVEACRALVADGTGQPDALELAWAVIRAVDANHQARTALHPVVRHF